MARILGSTLSVWKPVFSANTVKAILELVLRTWDVFEKPDPNQKPLEHEAYGINKRFHTALLKDRRFERMYGGILNIEWEEKRKDPTTGEYLGDIDINFTYRNKRSDLFFAFKCKKMNLTGKSNASEYTGKNGMMCFISGKYVGQLDSAGMIAYVMDGNRRKAIASVQKSMKNRAKILCLNVSARNHGLLESSSLPERKCVRESRHNPPGRSGVFKIHHLFLSVIDS